MKDRRDRLGGGVVLLVIAVLALLVGGGWAAAYYRAGETLAHGTTVDGVDVGGHTRAEAADLLRPALRERLTRPIAVTAAGRTVPVPPERAGLGVDLEATLAQGDTTRSWRPTGLWRHYAGGRALDPVLTVDGPAMAHEVATLQRRLGTRPRDGAIAVHRSRIDVTHPRIGHQLDPAETANALELAFSSQSGEAILVRHDVEPRIDDHDVDRAMNRIVNPALSGSVRLLLGDTPLRLQPQDFSAALSLHAKDGRLVARADRAWLARLAGGLASYARKPVDATVALVDGQPRVVPPKRGVAYSRDAVARAFLTAIRREPKHRNVRVHGHPTRPAVTAADARRLRIRDVVARSAAGVGGSGRGLKDAVATVDQTVLRPGGHLDLGRRLRDLADARGVGRLAGALSSAASRAGLGVSGEDARLVVQNQTRYGVLVHVTRRGSGQHRSVRVELWSRGSASGPAA